MIGASDGGYACAQGCFHVFLKGASPVGKNAMSVAINKFDSIHESPLLNGGEACICLLTEVMVPYRRDVRVAQKAPQPNHHFCGALLGGFSR